MQTNTCYACIQSTHPYLSTFKSKYYLKAKNLPMRGFWHIFFCYPYFVWKDAQNLKYISTCAINGALFPGSTQLSTACSSQKQNPLCACRDWGETGMRLNYCMHTTWPKYTWISFLLLILRQSQEAKLLLIWEKVINLLLRQVRYRGNFSEVVPHLTSLATGMTRFGEDKVTEGILGAIGLGKKSCYSHQYVPFWHHFSTVCLYLNHDCVQTFDLQLQACLPV